MSIQVTNLVKNFGEVTAVNDITFNVQTGEVLGFLGPNGAGKTTTMKVITCFLPQTSGEVLVDGLNIQEKSIEVRRKIGYLPEQNPLYLDMNVVDFLIFAANLQGVPSKKVRERLLYMLDICGLQEVRHKDIGELSKGYRQRVGLAQAMIHDPEILILDEPTSGLDPNQIVEIRNLIKEIGKQKTVILSTHILPEVQATCNRVLIIHEGKIVADGSPNELQNKFQASDIITLELKTGVLDPQIEIVPEIKIIPEVQSIELIEHSNGNYKFNIHTSKGQDIRETIFRKSVEKNWVILEMFKKETSLEEVFHQLTTNS
jgi:ABC-2 type transport system ATP-binding protein